MASDAPLARVISDSLKTVHNHGAKMYNDGQHLEAFRLYQGALFVVLQLLGSRPDLKFVIADGLNEVEESAPNDQLKAYRLHEVIDHVRSVLKTLFDDEFKSLPEIPGDLGKL